MKCYGLGENLEVDPETGLVEVRVADGGGLEIKEDGLSLQEDQKLPVWQSWSPTLTNLTLGSGTLTARYFNQGGLVMFSFTFTLGAGSAIGTEPQFSPPVTPVNWGYNPVSPSGVIHTGMVSMENNGVENYQGVSLVSATNSNIRMFVYSQGGTYGAVTPVTASVPFTWATGDTLQARGWYRGVY